MIPHSFFRQDIKYLFTVLLLSFSINAFSQTYTYIESDTAIEKEKREKEAFFKNKKDDAFTRLQNCTKQCGSYAADANNPKDPCTLPGTTPACICNCQKTYDGAIKDLGQQESAWRTDIAIREENYKNKKIEEQQNSLQKEEKNETERQKDKERDEKYEKQKREIEEQANRDKQKYDAAERAALKKTESIVNSNTNTGPVARTPEEQKELDLRQKISESNSKNAALQQSLNNAITATGNMIQNIIAAKQKNDEIKEKKIEKAYIERTRELNEKEASQRRKEIQYKQIEAKLSNEFISSNSIASHFLYKAYADYIVDQHFSNSDIDHLFSTLNTFFNDSEFVQISAFEFSSFLEEVTWEDGSILNLLGSSSFSHFLEIKKGLSFTDSVMNQLDNLIQSIKDISEQKFTTMGWGCVYFRNITYTSMYDHISYANEQNFPIYFDNSTNQIKLMINKPFLNFSFKLGKEIKRQNLLSPAKGDIRANIIKINSYHVTQTNNTFGLSPDTTNENTVMQMQMMRKVPISSYSKDLGCLVKFNADIEFSSSFDKTETVNMNIYLFRSIGYNEKYSNVSGEKHRYYVGYIDDLVRYKTNSTPSVYHVFLNNDYRFYDGAIDMITDMYEHIPGHLCHPVLGISDLSLVLASDEALREAGFYFFRDKFKK